MLNDLIQIVSFGFPKFLDFKDSNIKWKQLHILHKKKFCLFYALYRESFEENIHKVFGIILSNYATYIFKFDASIIFFPIQNKYV